MLKLIASLEAWGTPEFGNTVKQEISQVESSLLPLQQGLSQSDYVSDSGISVVILNSSDTAEYVVVNTGIFYSGVISGSCCADDPTPLNEQTEYCELQFRINKQTAETSVFLQESE